MLNLIRSSVRHQHVLKNFIVRDLKVKYRGTVFGYLWSLLEPLSLVAIYWFVFVVIARRGGPDYPLLVILGVLPFQFFNAVVSGGASALVSNAALIRRVYVPREIFLFGIVGSNAVVLLLSLLAAIPFLIAYEVEPGWRIVLLPVGITLLGALSLGFALVLSCINAIYRDVAYVLRVLLRLAFYASPVIYTLDMVPDRLRDIYLLNPVSVLIAMIRGSIMNTPFPFGWSHAAYAGLISLVALALGARGFARWQAKAVKFL